MRRPRARKGAAVQAAKRKVPRSRSAGAARRTCARTAARAQRLLGAEGRATARRCNVAQNPRATRVHPRRLRPRHLARAVSRQCQTASGREASSHWPGVRPMGMAPAAESRHLRVATAQCRECRGGPARARPPGALVRPPRCLLDPARRDSPATTPGELHRAAGQWTSKSHPQEQDRSSTARRRPGGRRKEARRERSRGLNRAAVQR